MGRIVAGTCSRILSTKRSIGGYVRMERHLYLELLLTESLLYPRRMQPRSSCFDCSCSCQYRDAGISRTNTPFNCPFVEKWPFSAIRSPFPDCSRSRLMPRVRGLPGHQHQRHGQYNSNSTSTGTGTGTGNNNNNNNNDDDNDNDNGNGNENENENKNENENDNDNDDNNNINNNNNSSSSSRRIRSRSKQTGRQTARQTDGQPNKPSHKQSNKQTNKHINTQMITRTKDANKLTSTCTAVTTTKNTSELVLQQPLPLNPGGSQLLLPAQDIPRQKQQPAASCAPLDRDLSPPPPSRPALVSGEEGVEPRLTRRF